MSAVRSGIPTSGTSLGASCTERCSFSPVPSSAASPKWGTTATPVTRPSPMVRPPPRASTIGSVSAMAAPDEPTTTAPPRQAATSASHTAECFRTLRMCMGELPAR